MSTLPENARAIKEEFDGIAYSLDDGLVLVVVFWFCFVWVWGRGVGVGPQ
jgi:hypothetical protein